MMGGFRNFNLGSGYRMMGGFGWIGGIVCLLIIVLIIMGIIALVRGSSYPSHHGHAVLPLSNSALEIVKNRYAKGEITKDQYDQMIRDLK